MFDALPFSDLNSRGVDYSDIFFYNNEDMFC